MNQPPPNAPMPPQPASPEPQLAAPEPPHAPPSQSASLPAAPPTGQFYAPPNAMPHAPPQKPGTNGFAVAALVFGLLGGFLLSVIFGVVALMQISRRPQAGKGAAIAGMAISAAWVVVGVGTAVILALNTDSDSTASDNGQVNVNEIVIGDCLNGLTEGRNIENLPVVRCTEPHDGEVFAEFPISAATFPGDAAVTTQAEEGCVERLRNYAPKAAEDPNTQLYYLHPTAASWLTGDRDVLCVALSASGTRTGSIFD
ncbi:septum formation family protein [Micromonospora sp. CPCC 205371]|nr:septum formation family protein [Micromonospora sp. CPCC 205371]